MGLLQKAVETYDAHEKFVGVEREGHEILAPISHIVTNSNIEITVNEKGEFCNARSVDKSEPKIIIPVTEESGGRTSASCAHPLCDQLCYIASCNEEKHSLYVSQLKKWTDSEYSHPFLLPILQYVESNTVLLDLVHSEIISSEEYELFQNEELKKKEDIKKKEKIEKQLIRWRVIGFGEESGPCWTNLSLFKKFTEWYQAQKSEEEMNLCMISGALSPIAQQHPKGIIPIKGNAKLISANDSKNFTYRGRFTTENQSATVGYISSQKAHNAIRWIASEQGASLVFGGRTFLCWNPQGKKICHATSPFQHKTKAITKPSEYKRELQKTLNGYRSELPEGKEGISIAVLDAATTGRLSVTYYNELLASDFLQRLHDWDKHCCWWQWEYAEECYGIQSPRLLDIVNCAFGVQRKEKDKTQLVTDDKIVKQQMQRLLFCRVDRAHIPFDLEKALVNKASMLLSYDEKIRRKILFVTCAIIKKFYYDHFKEEWSMSLEKDKHDRSYQFGRLLAVLEKVERDTYDKDESREPNAIRMQSVFCQRPMQTARNIESQLEKAYFRRLKPSSRIFYKNLAGDIFDVISTFPDKEWNQPLRDTYLMGYYLQRKELYTKKENREDE